MGIFDGKIKCHHCMGTGKVCNECHGQGKVYAPPASGGYPGSRVPCDCKCGKPPPKNYPCWVCDGTGRVSKE